MSGPRGQAGQRAAFGAGVILFSAWDDWPAPEMPGATTPVCLSPVLLGTPGHDSLSGVLARGYLVELASHDVALARRHGHPLAIGMLDIDHFKRVNDSFGHTLAPPP